MSGHLIAIERGDHRGRLTGQVDQYRGGGTAVLRAVVNTCQHDQGRHRGQGIGGGQQHGDGRYWPNTGQNADQGAEQAAHQGIEQIDGGGRNPKTGG